MSKVMLHKYTLLTLLLLFSATLLQTTLLSQRADAVTASDWRPGRIIDDAVFYNTNSMTPQQIQQFFDAKVPTCDRWRASSNPTYQPPWTCLKEYQENTATRENNVGRFNANGTPYQVPGGKLASQIVWDVAQEYGINPQVLIVMLQKEQGLVTDNWPWAVQYQKAMGYACPDTAPCDTQYYGFYNQVSSAAWQMKRYIAYPNSYNFKVGVTRNILWSPNTSCGSSAVFIENAPTAALYNYTPYQPNGAALNNMYGTGDGCSAYGNRNFWRYFNDWFGSTTVPNANIIISGAIGISDLSPNANDLLSISYTVKNTGYSSIDTGVLWICGSMNGKIFGGGSTRKVLAPGEQLTVSMPYTPTESGNLTVWACGNTPSGPGYVDGYPYGAYYDHRARSYIVGRAAIAISNFISPLNSTPRIGELNTIKYSVINRDAQPRDTGVLWICGSMNGKIFGGGSTRKVLAPGEQLTVSMPYTPTESGNLTVWACGNTPSGPGYVDGYPYGDWLDHRIRSYSVSNSPLLITWAVNHSGLQLTKNVAENLRYAVKNTGTLPTDTGVLWICGSINGKPFGGGSTRKVLAPGEQLTVSMPYTPTESGNLTVWACGNTPSGPGYVDGYPYGAWLDHRIRSFSVF